MCVHVRAHVSVYSTLLLSATAPFLSVHSAANPCLQQSPPLSLSLSVSPLHIPLSWFTGMFMLSGNVSPASLCHPISYFVLLFLFLFLFYTFLFPCIHTTHIPPNSQCSPLTRHKISCERSKNTSYMHRFLHQLHFKTVVLQNKYR